MVRWRLIIFLLFVNLSSSQVIITDGEVQRRIRDLKSMDNMAEASAVLISAGQMAVPGLLDLVKDKNLDPYVRTKAIELLGEIGSQSAVGPLIGLLNEPQSTVRAEAARTLGRLKGVEAVPELIKLLQDRHDAVRGEAIQALGLIGDNRALIPLINASNDEVFINRAKVMWALGELRDSRSQSVLIAGTKDSFAVVRANAALSLGRIGDSTSFYYLEPLLFDEDFSVREKAIQALGLIGGTKAVRAIGRLARDEMAVVRLSVIKMLESLGTVEGGVMILVLCQDNDTVVAGQANAAAQKISDNDLLEIVANDSLNISLRRKALNILKSKMEEERVLQLLLITFKNSPAEYIQAIVEERVIKGMNREQVKLSLGEPETWQITPEGEEIWTYVRFPYNIVFKKDIVWTLKEKSE